MYRRVRVSNVTFRYNFLTWLFLFVARTLRYIFASQKHSGRTGFHHFSSIFYTFFKVELTLFSMANGIGNIDELLLAILKQHVMLNILSEDSLDNFMQRYSLLIGNDYRRIKLFLQRAQPVVEL